MKQKSFIESATDLNFAIRHLGATIIDEAAKSFPWYAILVSKLVAWYRKEGFVQFMLGNEWNDSFGKAVGGRGIVVFGWLMVIISAVQTAMILCRGGG